VAADVSAAGSGAACPVGDIRDISGRFQSWSLCSSGRGAELLLGTRWHLDLLALRGGCVSPLQPVCTALLRGLAEGAAVLRVGFWGAESWLCCRRGLGVRAPAEPIRGRFLPCLSPGCGGAAFAFALCLPCVSFHAGPATPLAPRVWAARWPELWPGWHCPFSALSPAAEQPCHPEIASLGAICVLSLSFVILHKQLISIPVLCDALHGPAPLS